MSVLILKNIHRGGKAVVKSSIGDVDVQVKKTAGCEGYAIFVEGKPKGVSRMDAEAAWNWIISYFGITTVKAPEVKPKKKRTPKVHKLLAR